MSNENKTALTAEEIAYKYVHGQHDALTENQEKIDMAKDINDLISLQTKERDKEIEQCKNLANIQQKRWIERNEKLQSTIESQQKEIEELKTSIEGVFGWREKNHHLTISEKQLKSQLSEVTKERDEAVRNAFNESRLTHPMVGFKHDTFEDYLKSLTPTKE